MKTVYLHIGLHKTGSTYIQKVFTENRDRILKYGVVYPEIGAEFMFGHHNIAWSLIPEKKLRNRETLTLPFLRQQLINAASNQLFLSSEEFDFLKIDQIYQLKEVLPCSQTKVIAYIRNPVHSFYSRWQENIKHGDTTSLLEYYNQTIKNLGVFNYHKILDRWAKVFGKDSLEILIYDNLLIEQLDIYMYLIQQVLKLPIAQSKLKFPKNKVNPASSIEFIEVLRYFNTVGITENLRNNLTQKLAKYLYVSESGRKIEKRLRLAREKSSFYLNVESLEMLSLNIEQEFIRDYHHQIRNAASANKLFPDFDIKLRLPLLDSECLISIVNLAELYQSVVSS